MRQLYQHINQENIQKIIYAKATDYKIQVFLEYGESIRGQNSISIFRKLWELYDMGKNVGGENCVITIDSFLMIEGKITLK